MNADMPKIYSLYGDDILRLAYSYTKNISDAEDITQNVFIKYYNTINKFESDEHKKNWLIKVTINECKNLALSFWKRNTHQLNEEVTTDEKEYFSNLEVRTALFNLSKKHRLIIFLYYYEGYKVSEIADMMNMKKATIQTNLRRAREKLRKVLKEEWEYEK